MGEKDDGLRLSLSLGCGDDEKREKISQSPQPFPLKLMRSTLPFVQQRNQQQLLLLQKSSFLADAFPSSSERNAAEPRSSLRGIDVNRPATVIDCDEEVMVSSPNSTVSSVSGKRSEREENEAERGSSSLEDDGGDAARKKLRLSKEQAALLEETFKEHNTLNPKQKLALAKQLNLRPRQVEVWFQNRRARTKLKQTEVDCEYLKRCCENLTEENRRLQKEVNELRALKLSPQFYMNMNPPTTLTMCPQCERVAVSASSSSSAAAASTSLAATSTGIPRQQNPLTGSNQHSMPKNPWAAIFPNQSHGVRQPRS
ncbi:homeobox-leucine zipper protein HAT4 [Coffea arabica]|uniref:Homeobox-leucine zipper protein HAT4 n=1 Tax=Coffea arabica TaxID=13443 RepID=A0A6P6VVI4_COFAR|nr:homeobox-leucine zipper protein HAT3-like isoform X2 [Coffea arabica]